MTLQVTLVLVAPVTAAVKACVLPKSSEAVAGVTVTLTEDGVGVGVGVGVGDGWTMAETPLQLAVQTTIARRRRIDNTGRRGCGAR